MPPQGRTVQGFAGAAVKIDLILKGIKMYRVVLLSRLIFSSDFPL